MEKRAYNTSVLKRESILLGHKVLRNTYALLSATLLFSAFTAILSMNMALPPLHPFITLGIYFGLLYGISRTQNTSWGIAGVFALTGFLGYTLGPLLNFYLNTLPQGGQCVALALGGTGLIFFLISGYAMASKKDFSFMNGFLTVGALVAFISGLGAWLFSLPALSLAVSAAFMFISSGIILVQTSEIIRGGERNYIAATIILYISLFNIFTSLLQLLGIMGDNRE